MRVRCIGGVMFFVSHDVLCCTRYFDVVCLFKNIATCMKQNFSTLSELSQLMNKWQFSIFFKAKIYFKIPISEQNGLFGLTSFRKVGRERNDLVQRVTKSLTRERKTLQINLGASNPYYSRDKMLRLFELFLQ